MDNNEDMNNFYKKNQWKMKQYEEMIIQFTKPLIEIYFNYTIIRYDYN